jgi:hypothetical protein
LGVSHTGIFLVRGPRAEILKGSWKIPRSAAYELSNFRRLVRIRSLLRVLAPELLPQFIRGALLEQVEELRAITIKAITDIARVRAIRGAF